MVRFPLLAPKEKPLICKGFSFFTIRDNSFYGWWKGCFVCLRIQKYALLYTLCKMEMQNELQEFCEIVLHLVFDGCLF